jgi:hypothetical protein
VRGSNLVVRRARGDFRRTARIGASGVGSWSDFELGTLGSGTGETSIGGWSDFELGTLGSGTGETSIGTLGRVESTINRGRSVSGVGATGSGSESRSGTGGGSGDIARPRISATSRNALIMEGPKARGLRVVAGDGGMS